MTKYAKEIELMKTICSESSKVMLNSYNTSRIIDKDGGIDIVTKADIDIDKYARNTIKKTFPLDEILSEENENKSFYKNKARRFWTIDPIDGTWNYVNHIPFFGIQIALVDGDDVVASIIYLPLVNGGETYTAEKGQGAYLNGDKLEIVSRHKRGQEIFLFGDLDIRNYDNAYFLIDKMKRTRPFFGLGRMIGSSAINFSLIASNRADALMLINQSKWDLFPGLLLVQEAGALICNSKGNSFSASTDKDIFVANNLLTMDILLK